MIDYTRITHGVLSDDALFSEKFRDGLQHPIYKQCTGIVDVLTLARAFGLESVFILPSSKLFTRIKKYPARFLAACGPWTVKPEQLENVVTCWQANVPSIRIVMPGIKRNQWQLETLTDPRELFEVARTLQLALGVRIFEPVRTGRALALAGMGGRQLDACVKSQQVFRDHHAKTIINRRDLSDGEKRAAWLHVFDKKKMFLSAYGVPLGNSNYVYARKRDFDKKLPGLWNVTIKARRATPKHARAVLGDIQKGWFWTPTLGLYARHEYKIEVTEAYIFPDNFRALEGFSNTIRRALEHFTPDSVYTKCIKSIYTRFYSWCAPANPTGREGSKFLRYDWRSMIIDEANTRLRGNLIKLQTETGQSPAAIFVDELWFFSDEPDAEKALPHPFTGPDAAYKHVFTIPAGEAVQMWEKGLPLRTIKLRLKQ